jgi:DNA-binding CsgD family transcriptional regulator
MANSRTPNHRQLVLVSTDRSPGTSGEPAAEHEVLDDARVSAMNTLGEELYVLSFPIPQFRYPADITTAEKEIIRLLLDGLSTRQISKQLGTSPQTVSKQLASIYIKAGVKSRAGLVAWMLGRT